MKKMMAVVTIAIMCFMFSGCAMWQAPVIPPQGAIFSSTSAPIQTQFRDTDLGSKRGEATSIAILGLIGIGDASVYEAAQNGNIQTVKHVDYEIMNVLGIYVEFKTVVYGD